LKLLRAKAQTHLKEFVRDEKFVGSKEQVNGF
jgi:hypothetical protein